MKKLFKVFISPLILIGTPATQFGCSPSTPTSKTNVQSSIRDKFPMMDHYDMMNQELDVVKSIAVVTEKNQLTVNGDNIELPFSDLPFCKDDHFSGQRGVDATSCTAFLVAPNIVATAGHCVGTTDLNACSNLAFIFDYKIEAEGSAPVAISKSSVFNCKKVLHVEQSKEGISHRLTTDLALIEIEPAFPGKSVMQSRQPLKLAKTMVPFDTKVSSIGHPLTLAIKKTFGFVGLIQGENILLRISLLPGNSGGPLFNYGTYEVVGLNTLIEADIIKSTTGVYMRPGESCWRAEECGPKNVDCPGEAAQFVGSPYIRAALEKVLATRGK